jgi:molybdopterin-containing oxidoreductase family membrane subunit
MMEEGALDARVGPRGIDPSLLPEPILAGERDDFDDRALTDSLMSAVWTPHGRGFWLLFLPCAALVGLLLVAIAVTLFVGIGAWGNNIPVAWAFGITNFVWWIGIGHAGTLISAILLLFQQSWRTSINRFAEAMTLFAVVCAGMYPILHMGRPWFAYWLFPYPATMGVWPQFRSPLTWDVFAVSTYLTVSLLFWFLGLVPDLATLRDASPSRAKRVVYGIFALGWRGSSRQWHDYRWAYLLLGGLATPLVVSVHTIVSWDFAVAILPGWHSTVFPPYFVAGAVFSGFAMVLTLIIPARRVLRLEKVVTRRHLENMAKILLVTGWMVTYGYLIETFIAWYSGDQFEIGAVKARTLGPYAPFYWLLLVCNCLVPQTFWSSRLRRNLAWLWIASVLINVGMWLERFVIIVVSLHRDYLPSSWRMYYPTWVDVSLTLGTMGFFGCGFLLFLRFLPAVSATEVKELAHELCEHERADHGGRAVVAELGEVGP